MWYDNFDKNIVIFGGTQQGKTVLANEIYAKSKRFGVFWNPDGEDFVSGWKVQSFDEIIRGIKYGYRKFSFEMPWYSLNDDDKYDQLVMNLLLSGEEHNFGWVFVTDEAHDIAREGKKGTPLHLASKRGLKRGVQNVVLTQDPATLSNSVIRQCDILAWVGPMSPQDVTYMKERLKLDPSGFKQPGKYEYFVINREGDEIARGKTKSKFA